VRSEVKKDAVKRKRDREKKRNDVRRNHGDAVIRLPHLTRWLTRIGRFGWRDDRAAQILEFAISLPLLVAFVVGIFDFSGAFTLKQKLTNAARDAARAAAADPANDLTNPSNADNLPTSVNDAFQVVQNYLTANKITNCGLTAPSAPTNLTWTFSITGSCTVGVNQMIINRGYFYSSLGGGALPNVNCSSGAVGNGNVAVISTCVSIQYVYQWTFSRVASLIGSTLTLPNSITVTAVSMNEN
jgi:Flp pilus assembly protein TadG